MNRAAAAGRQRLAIVTNFPTPYREDLFARLGEREGLRLRVFFCSRAGSAGSDGTQRRYPHEFVAGFPVRSRTGEERYVPMGLSAGLSSFDPDVLLTGGSSLPTMASVAFARRRRRPVWVWWAGTGVSERPRSFLQIAIRRRLFSRVDGFLAYGRESADYLRRFGVGAPVVVMGNNTRDARRYAAAVDQERAQIGDPTHSMVLFVGQLIGRKNVGALIEAWAALRPPPEVWRLGIVGSGPLEQALRRQGRGCAGVDFLGSLPAARMPALYARASAVVCPSLMDQWPQVVNEAMAAALPVVVSVAAGVDDDYLVDNLSGLRFDPAVPGALRESLRRVMADPTLARRLGAAAREAATARDVRSCVATIESRVLLGARRLPESDP